MNSSEGDVVILISYTIHIKILVEISAIARENNATVITANTGGAGSSLSLALNVPEDTNMFMLIRLRLVQLTLTNVLTTRFMLRRSVKFWDNLKPVKDALKESRFDKMELEF